MFYAVKLKIGYLIVLCCIVFCLILYREAPIIDAVSMKNDECLIIDPGHGGIDGGALSFAGDKESDINLAIALKLAKISDLYGIKYYMTREDDSFRTDAQSYNEREDLEHRVSIINSKLNAVLISIHQNCFPTSQPSGAQVLFADNNSSKLLGNICHNNIVSNLQPTNRRVAEPAPKKLYITSNAKCPAILVECGFMSNQGDIQNLKNEKYQIKLSALLLASYIQFRNS